MVNIHYGLQEMDEIEDDLSSLAPLLSHEAGGGKQKQWNFKPKYAEHSTLCVVFLKHYQEINSANCKVQLG